MCNCKDERSHPFHHYFVPSHAGIHGTTSILGIHHHHYPKIPRPSMMPRRSTRSSANAGAGMSNADGVAAKTNESAGACGSSKPAAKAKSKAKKGASAKKAAAAGAAAARAEKKKAAQAEKEKAAQAKKEKSAEVAREREAGFELQFARLKKFQEDNGHCRAPEIRKDNDKKVQPEAYHVDVFVKTTRREWRKLANEETSSLTEERILRLRGLGFEFEPRKTGWDARMQELKGYKALYHNCNVPIGDVNYPELARWVKQQRADHKALMEGKQSPLTKERWDELEKIGFEWVLREKKAKAAEDTDDSAKAKAAAPLESKKRGNDHAYHSDTDDEVEIEKDDSPETRPRMKSRRELKNFMNRGHGK